METMLVAKAMLTVGTGNVGDGIADGQVRYPGCELVRLVSIHYHQSRSGCGAECAYSLMYGEQRNDSPEASRFGKIISNGEHKWSKMSTGKLNFTRYVLLPT